MSLGIDIVIVIIFAVWFLYDRYRFMQRTKAKVAQIEQLAKAQIEQAEQSFVSKAAALDKVYAEAISSANLQMDELKWEQTLLSACADDVKHVESQFHGEMTMDKFNLELTSAAFYFSKSWQSHKALRPAVARIINLLQLFVLNSIQPQASIDPKQFN